MGTIIGFWFVFFFFSYETIRVCLCCKPCKLSIIASGLFLPVLLAYLPFLMFFIFCICSCLVFCFPLSLSLFSFHRDFTCCYFLPYLRVISFKGE